MIFSDVMIPDMNGWDFEAKPLLGNIQNYF